MQVLCYLGKATRSGNLAVPFESLLATSADYARRQGLTGLLAVADGYFLHLVEGEPDAVEGLVGRIAVFWNHESPTVLFEHDTDVRAYAQWSCVIARRPATLADMAGRMAYIRGFLHADGSASAADAFRYFLTPNRAARPPGAQTPVRQIAVCSNSVLWFNPVFSHLAERYGTQASALKVSETGRDADAFPLDYADVVAGDGVGLARLVGISESLVGSTLSSPLLSKVELLVFLMRRSGHGSDTAFVAQALRHPQARHALPGVLFITPGGNAELSATLRRIAAEAGMESAEHTGSVLDGGSTWGAIRDWLAAHPARPPHKLTDA
ncbi:BLUF domain-containing protein [Ramlibacter sp. H39-3-26]|uniref:BLUF domain-containing protein n=1 Tax=Curvibacter soli TaxID=3031331 RepID=UPI0023DB0151|nr:BLUF domain-containing protein [Ramlibacter sp. H39-3-26]MDF1485057.1 BLUF domain-containing protein [Ramlibacter sp. H39-3-26]